MKTLQAQQLPLTRTFNAIKGGIRVLSDFMYLARKVFLFMF